MPLKHQYISQRCLDSKHISSGVHPAPTFLSLSYEDVSRQTLNHANPFSTAEIESCPDQSIADQRIIIFLDKTDNTFNSTSLGCLSPGNWAMRRHEASAHDSTDTAANTTPSTDH